MKSVKLNLFSRVLCAAMLSFGLVLTSCDSNSNATDLSGSESANCYVVSNAGAYKFKSVKGNSST
jgi:hypothetical protein